MRIVVNKQLKPSGVEWIGKIPQHWRTTKVRFVAHLESGHTPSRNHPEYWVPEECTIPWFSLADVWQIRDGLQEHLGDTAESVSETGLANSSARLLPKDTVVLSRTASVGFSGIMPRPMATTQDFVNWVCGPRVLPVYLLYVFRAMRQEFDRLTMGSTHQTIYMPDARRLAMPLPSVEEQRVVVGFLQNRLPDLDDLILKKRRQIELLQQQRQSLIMRAVTKGLDPNAQMRDSGIPWLGQIPAHWAVKRLKFLGEVRGGVTKGRVLGDGDTIELPYLRVANVQDGYLDLNDVSTIEILKPEKERYCLRRGDILMNEGGDFDKLGRGCVWEGQIDPCLHQNHVFAVRPNKGINPYWIATTSLAHYLKHFFILRSKQSTNLASISSSNLKESPIVLPPDQEQKEILTELARATSHLDSIATELQSQIALLGEYRQALVSHAVTGKLAIA